MQEFLQKAKSSTRVLNALSGAKKNQMLLEMAQALRSSSQTIIEHNALDMENAHTSGLSDALKDRLLLNESRIEAMAIALEEIAALKDPIGRVLEGWVNENGLKIEKVTIPIGVVGIIYESRPNVTSDTAGLCFKSSNVCVLKGGKEADNSNRIIAQILQDVLQKNGLPREIIALLPDASREGVSGLLNKIGMLILSSHEEGKD